MDVCARHVGEFLSIEQIADEAGMGLNEWRYAPRKITRHLKARYGGVPGWPLTVIDGRRISPARTQHTPAAGQPTAGAPPHGTGGCVAPTGHTGRELVGERPRREGTSPLSSATPGA